MPKQYLFHDQINYPDLIYSLYQGKIHRETRSNIVHLFKKIKFKIDNNTNVRQSDIHFHGVSLALWHMNLLSR